MIKKRYLWAAGTLFILWSFLFVITASSIAQAQPAPKSGTPLLRGQKSKLQEEWAGAGQIQVERRLSQEIRADSVGDQIDFWALNFATEKYYQTAAICRVVSPMGNGYMVNIYVEKQLNNPLLTPTTLINIRNEFVNKILPSLKSAFGDPPTGDFTILILDIQDGGASTFVSSYYDPTNEYPKSSDPSSPFYYSNERHLIYMDVAPQQGGTGGIPGSRTFYGCMAHEFQHFIHYFADPLEETWVEEGLSGLARFICGYGHPESHVTYFSVFPETSLVIWNDELANYGATYLFMLYLYERYGEGALTQRIVANTGRGIEGINSALAQLGYNVVVDDIFKNWVVANYLNNTSIAGGIYGYRASFSGISDAPGNLTPTQSHAAYPASEKNVTLSSYSAHYIEFSRLGGLYDTFILIPFTIYVSDGCDFNNGNNCETKLYSYTATRGSLRLNLSGIDSHLGMHGVQKSISGLTPLVFTNLSANSCISTSGGTCGASVEGGCFIATAAYGSPLEKEVVTLQEFRDRYLVTHPFGRWLASLYYEWSPAFADQVAKSEVLRVVARLTLYPVVGLSRVALKSPGELAAGAFGLVLIITMVLLGVRRRKSIGMN